MLTPTTELAVNDVFRSDKLAFGRYRQISAFNRSAHLVGFEDPADCGNDATDESRAEALWLVLAVPMGKLGDGCMGNDASWPYVVARRLNDDGSYNPHGELIAFSPSFWPAVREVHLVGQMRLEFAVNLLD